MKDLVKEYISDLGNNPLCTTLNKGKIRLSTILDDFNQKALKNMESSSQRIISESDIDPENIPYIPMPGKNKKTFKLTEDKRTAVCPSCYGTGKNHGDESMEENCWGCNGTGQTER